MFLRAMATAEATRPPSLAAAGEDHDQRFAIDDQAFRAIALGTVQKIAATGPAGPRRLRSRTERLLAFGEAGKAARLFRIDCDDRTGPLGVRGSARGQQRKRKKEWHHRGTTSWCKAMTQERRRRPQAPENETFL